jgi:hypothetical protein
MSKAELLEQILLERKLLEEALAQVPEEQVAQPGAENGWSVKDILAHIVAWEQQMIRWLGEITQGEIPEWLASTVSDDDVDRWNEQVYLANRDRPLDEVRSEFERSYGQALSAVKDMPEEALLDPEFTAWRQSRPLWYVVAANTFWHYKEHRESIQAWLEGRAAG